MIYFPKLNLLPLIVIKDGWNIFFKEEKLILSLWFLIVNGLCIIFDIWSLLLCITTSVLITLFRKTMAGGICCNNKKLFGKTIVITGSNTGIGKATALDLANRGANIILACRDMKKTALIASEIRSKTSSQVSTFKLDLASLDSVRSFAAVINKSYNQIYCLINNAGVMMCPYGKTRDGFEMQMGVNHLGHFLLTKLLLPRLKGDHEARIINVSSMAHNMGKIPFGNFTYDNGKSYNSTKAYGNSKLANILHIRALAKRLQGSNIQVFSLHPGCVQSNLGRHLPLNIGSFFSTAMALVAKTTFEGAQTTIYCATEARQHPYFYFCDCLPLEPKPDALNDEIAEKMWQVSDNFTTAN